MEGSHLADIDALRPFLDITTIISAARYPTVSMVLPLLDGLIDVLHEDELAESIPCLRTALLNEIRERFDYIYNSDIYCVATVVDPRYKMVPFTDDLRASRALMCVVAAMQRIRQSVKLRKPMKLVVRTRCCYHQLEHYHRKSVKPVFMHPSKLLLH